MFKKFNILFVLLILLIPILVFGQDEKNGSDFLKQMDVPKIVKNNLRITKIEIKKVDILPNDEVRIDGNIEIKNYSDSPTSRLNLAIFSGLKEDSYYLKYPIYTREISESFVLEPKQTINRNFSFTGKNLSRFGSMGIEARIIDEYYKIAHIESTLIPIDIFSNDIKDGEIISGFSSNLSVGDKSVPINTGPTFYPKEEDMFININFQSKITEGIYPYANLSVFEREYFKSPIFEQKINIENLSPSLISIKIPEDFKSGIYPFELELLSLDNNIFIPKIYGRFIIGGNMTSVADVYLDLAKRKTDSLTLVVQGNPINTLDEDKTSQTKFSAEINIFTKNEEIIFSKKIDNQNVTIYRNIDIQLDKEIKTKKISKAKVNLSDENGIFSTYEKEFEHEKTFNYWNLLWLLMIPLVTLSYFKLKNKNISKIMIMFLFFSFNFINSAYAGMYPTPYKHFGAFVFDDWDLNLQSQNYYNGVACDPYCDYKYEDDKDIDRLEGDQILDMLGIDISFEQPVFYDQDPDFCYAPGQVAPVIVRRSYTVGNLDPNFYLKNFLTVGQSDWYWNLRDWSYVENSINSYPIDLGNLGFDNSKDFNLDYLYNYIGDLESQSFFDYLYNGNSVKVSTSSSDFDIFYINSEKIDNAISKMINPISYSSVPTTLSWFDDQNYAVKQYSIVMPEKPGIYIFNSSVNYKTSYYTSQHRIKVCDIKHDADYLMPGKQYIDNDSNLIDEDGSVLSGYLIQKYPITPGIIRKNLDQIAGFTDSPFNEFSFVTVANYCGRQSLSSSPTTVNLNNWVNYFSTATDLYQKSGYTNLQNLINSINSYGTAPSVSLGTYIPVFANYYSGSQWYTTRASTTATYRDYVSLDNVYNYIVRNTNDGLRFIDLNDAFLPKTTTGDGGFITKALNLSELVNVPTKTFSEMLSEGKFNYGNYIKASENNSSNTYLIKENSKDNANYYTCSLYEDFCPNVEGVQYINKVTPRILLYNIDSQGNHIFASSTLSNTSPQVAVQMCSAINPLTVSCTVNSPLDANLRNSGTEIEFKANVTGINSSFPTTYSWTGATAKVDQSLATTSFQSIGSYNNVSVQVTNGSNTKTATCSVNIVAADFTASCSANEVMLGEESVYRAYPNEYGVQYQWLRDDLPINGANSQTYSVEYDKTQSYPLTVRVTKDGLSKTSSACPAQVVACKSSTYCKNNFVEEIQCVDDVAVINTTSEICGDPRILSGPEVQTFKFIPDTVATTSNYCKLNLVASNVSSCRLIKNNSIYSDLTSYISGTNLNIQSQNIPIGTYQLGCTGSTTPEESVSYLFGTRQCILNPNYKEF